MLPSILYTVGVEIGNLPNEQHGISGKFHILDSKTIYIEDFNYDGGGPGTYGILSCTCLLLLLYYCTYWLMCDSKV